MSDVKPELVLRTVRKVGAGQFATATQDKVGDTAIGAVVGGLVGAILGAAGDHMGWGALAGSVAGGVGGFLIGRSQASKPPPIDTQIPSAGGSTNLPGSNNAVIGGA